MGEAEESTEEPLTSPSSDIREARIQALLTYVGGGLDYFAQQQGDGAAFKALLALWTSSQESDVIDDPRLRPLIAHQMAKFGLKGSLHRTAEAVHHVMKSTLRMGEKIRYKIVEPQWRSEDD